MVARQVAVAALTLAVAACGGGDDGGGGGGTTVTAHANVLHGPSSSDSGVAPRLAGPAALTDGRWQVSPDEAQATLVALDFYGAEPGTDQQVDLTDCMLTWTRSDAALQQLLDCPFEIPVGSYIGMSVGMSTTFQIKLDDALNGLYTDASAPSKLSATAPGAGATFVDYVVPGPGGQGDRLDSLTYFTSPLEVTEASAIEIQLVVDMTHTMEVDVASGAPEFRSDFVPVPAFIYATPEPVTKVAFYSDLGTAANALETPNFPPNTLRFFYSSATEPAFVWSGLATAGCQSGDQPSNAWDVDAATAPEGPQGGPVAGGDLGRDASGTLCFALPNGDWTAQTGSVIELPEAAGLGTTASATCQTDSAIPAPTSGSSYASGCPTITAEHTASLTLVAN
jgi:hypothetical protein